MLKILAAYRYQTQVSALFLRGGGRSPADIDRVWREEEEGGHDKYMSRGFLEQFGPSQEFKAFQSSIIAARTANLFRDGSLDLEITSSAGILSAKVTPKSWRAILFTWIWTACISWHVDRVFITKSD